MKDDSPHLVLPPHSLEAEQAVIGGVLLDNEAWSSVVDVASESDFYRSDHRTIFRRVCELMEAGGPADVVTLAEALEAHGELPTIGGLPYLNALAANTPSAANARRYADKTRNGHEAAEAWHEMIELGRQTIIGGVRRVFTGRDFLGVYMASNWLIERILERGYLYALTALWGHGKTGILLTLALHVASGRPLHGLTVKRDRVLYLCGENPNDVRARMIASFDAFDFDREQVLDFMDFTEAPFNIDDDLERRRFLAEAARHGPYGLAVVDTGPAHSDRDDENSNAQAHALAMGLRSLIEPLGNPAVLAAMHPSKNATRETLQPRGGGAFSASIDGELCCWLEQDTTRVEFFHRTKLRGPGFGSLWFDLQKRELEQYRDNCGHHPTTVVALPCAPPEQIGRITEVKEVKLKDDERIALDALRDELAATGEGLPPTSELPGGKRGVRVEAWRRRFYARLGESRDEITQGAKRQAFNRGSKGLIARRVVGVFEQFAWFW